MEVTSQIVVTERIKKAASGIEGSGLEFIRNTVKFIQDTILNKPYEGDAIGEEKKIRWTRTADQVLNDGYVYKGKGCTDLTVLFQALCGVVGYQTSFLRLKDENGAVNHSVAEVRVDDEWYVVDVANNFQVKKGAIKDGEVFQGFTLWKRGRDGWDIGLKPSS